MVNIINAVKNNYVKYLARTAGAVGVALIARDAHCYGKEKADSFAKSRDAKAVEYFVENTISAENPSVTKTKMQNAVLNFELNHNFRAFINSFRGYFKGFFSNMVNDVIPLTLASVALFAKNKKVAAGSAIGLGLVGVYTFLRDGLGIGKQKYISK